MATKPAFKIDSKGNLSVSGDFTFFQGDYDNAPAEEKLKENLRTYLGVRTDGVGENLIPDSESLYYKITSTSHTAYIAAFKLFEHLTQEELDSFVGKKITTSYDISNAGDGTSYPNVPTDRPYRFGGFVQAVWKDTTETNTATKNTWPGWPGESKGSLRRHSFTGTLTPPSGYNQLVELKFCVELFCHPTNAGTTWIFANPKVEVGSWATAWTPNPLNFKHTAGVNYLPVLTDSNNCRFVERSYDANNGIYTLTATSTSNQNTGFAQVWSYNVPCKELAGKLCRLHADSLTSSNTGLAPRIFTQFYDLYGNQIYSTSINKEDTTITFFVPETAVSFCYILRASQFYDQKVGDTITFTKPKLEIDIGYNTPWCRSPLDWGRFEGGGLIYNTYVYNIRGQMNWIGVSNYWSPNCSKNALVGLFINQTNSNDYVGIWSQTEDGGTSWPLKSSCLKQDWTFTGTKAYNSSLFTIQAPTVKLDCTIVQLKNTGADIALKWGSSTGNVMLYNSGNIVMNGYIVQKNNRGNLEFRNSNDKAMGLLETISTTGEYKGLRIRSYSDTSVYMEYDFVHDGTLDTRSVRCITISSTQPSSAKKGDIWIQPET